MKKTKTRIVRIIAAMLCICIMCPCMTAFAMADDANAGIETTVAPEPTTAADSEAEDTEAEELSPEDKLKEYLGSFGLSWDDLMKMLDVDDDSTTGTVVTNGGRLNVRTGGGMDYNVIDQLLCGEQVKVIGRDGDWYQIIVPEKTGYVYSDYLRVIENADTASSDDLMALLFLQQHDFEDLASFEQYCSGFSEKMNDLQSRIKADEARMSENAVLQKQIINYVKTKDVYAAYRKAGYSKKFYNEHESEIIIHKAAKKAFDDLGLKKLPTVKSLKAEYAELLAEKKSLYSDYYKLKNEQRDLLIYKANIERIMQLDEEEKERSRQRQQEEK